MDKGILKKAVELADGWEWATYSDSDFIELEKADGAYWYDEGEPITPENMPRILKDALAAQLVRQYYECCPGDPLFYEYDAMDLLKYIVKPKALEKGEGK